MGSREREYVDEEGEAKKKEMREGGKQPSKEGVQREDEGISRQHVY